MKQAEARSSLFRPQMITGLLKFCNSPTVSLLQETPLKRQPDPTEPSTGIPIPDYPNEIVFGNLGP